MADGITDLVFLDKRDVTVFKPQEALINDAKADAILDMAKRLHDWDIVDRAVDAKLDNQEDFVQWWRGAVTVGHGGDRSKNADQRSCSVDDAEALTSISQQQVSRWAKALQDRQAYRERIVGAAYQKAMAEARGGVDNDHFRTEFTGDNEWYTPAEYIELVRLFFGEIDLDAASSDHAQKTIKAKQYFTVERDGLMQEWHGRVWLNPPYAQPFIQQFAEKMVSEVTAGNVYEAVMLTHNYTDTKWFHLAESVASRLCFTRGRIGFIDPDGVVAAPTQGQAFFYYGDRGDEFAAAFAHVGFVR